MAAAIVGLQARASMVTTAPLSAPASASRRSKAGIATCSQDVSSTASWPSTRRSLVAKAERPGAALGGLRRGHGLGARGLAVDGDQVGRVRPDLARPGHEACG